ncbi:hypothetical protein BD410DRAFT_899784 [Rickenella mellea]|uniref:Zinc finger PHD-type domain-containing protein n=1 Tax=Rickenella mellea TaxID=50990 RepID=A0A4Y7PYX0_9AGAM|nr:hypothetical protein BD410DRAFT_899784 [Rickenella mellea]
MPKSKKKKRDSPYEFDVTSTRRCDTCMRDVRIGLGGEGNWNQHVKSRDHLAILHVLKNYHKISNFFGGTDAPDPPTATNARVSSAHFGPQPHALLTNLEQSIPKFDELLDEKPFALQPESMGSEVVQSAQPSVTCHNDERPDRCIAEDKSRAFATPLTNIHRDLLETNTQALRSLTTTNVMPNPQAPNSTCIASESSSHSPKESQTSVANICGSCFRRIDADPIVCDGLCGLSYHPCCVGLFVKHPNQHWYCHDYCYVKR